MDFTRVTQNFTYSRDNLRELSRIYASRSHTGKLENIILGRRERGSLRDLEVVVEKAHLIKISLREYFESSEDLYRILQSIQKNNNIGIQSLNLDIRDNPYATGCTPILCRIIERKILTALELPRGMNGQDTAQILYIVYKTNSQMEILNLSGTTLSPQGIQCLVKIVSERRVTKLLYAEECNSTSGETLDQEWLNEIADSKLDLRISFRENDVVIHAMDTSQSLHQFHQFPQAQFMSGRMRIVKSGDTSVMNVLAFAATNCQVQAKTYHRELQRPEGTYRVKESRCQVMEFTPRHSVSNNGNVNMHQPQHQGNQYKALLPAHPLPQMDMQTFPAYIHSQQGNQYQGLPPTHLIQQLNQQNYPGFSGVSRQLAIQAEHPNYQPLPGPQSEFSGVSRQLAIQAGHPNYQQLPGPQSAIGQGERMSHHSRMQQMIPQFRAMNTEDPVRPGITPHFPSAAMNQQQNMSTHSQCYPINHVTAGHSWDQLCKQAPQMGAPQQNPGYQMYATPSMNSQQSLSQTPNGWSTTYGPREPTSTGKIKRKHAARNRRR